MSETTRRLFVTIESEDITKIRITALQTLVANLAERYSRNFPAFSIMID